LEDKSENTVKYLELFESALLWCRTEGESESESESESLNITLFKLNHSKFSDEKLQHTYDTLQQKQERKKDPRVGENRPMFKFEATRSFIEDNTQLSREKIEELGHRFGSYIVISAKDFGDQISKCSNLSLSETEYRPPTIKKILEFKLGIFSQQGHRPTPLHVWPPNTSTNNTNNGSSQVQNSSSGWFGSLLGKKGGKKSHRRRHQKHKHTRKSRK
jgi:hypothetical protein